LTRTFSGRVWRHIPSGGNPLDLQYLLRAAGRWNRPGLYGALYTGLSWAAVVAEYRKHQLLTALRAPRDLVQIEIRVESVLDLVRFLASPRATVLSPLTRGPLEVPEFSAEALHKDTWGSLDTCHRLADWCRVQGFLGLIVPCAPDPDETNLVVYPENRPQQLAIESTDVRIPLNYGPAAFLDAEGQPTRDSP